MYFLSVGHGKGKSGAYDPGASANGETEYTVCEKVAQEFIAKSKGKVTLVPLKMYFEDRIKWVNARAQKSDILVEIHMNSSSATSSHGSMMFYQTEKTVDKTLAEDYLSKFCKEAKTWNRGVQGDTTNRHGRLAMVRDTVTRSFLLEMSFITNKDDLRNIQLNGSRALLSLFGLMDIPPNTWAKPSVEKSKRKGVATDWSNPQQIIGNPDLENMLFRSKLLDQFTGNGVSKERLAVLLDRLGSLDKLPDLVS